MELNEKLLQLRKKNGFTQAELAEKLNVSRQSVSNWELGTVTPSIERLKALSQLYNVPWESFLSDEIILEYPAKENTKGETLSKTCDDDTEKNLSEKNGKIRIKVIVIFLIIILVVISVVLAVFVATAVYDNHKNDEQVQLDEMMDGEIYVSDENDFDLEF